MKSYVEFGIPETSLLVKQSAPDALALAAA